MVVFPNVKINLGLNVIRKRDDGYHDISTVMVGVDWCDVLEVVISDSPVDRLVCSGLPVDCPPEKNLVMKALRQMRSALSSRIPPLDIYLHKNVPDGAGLGGGSSDAAFLIKAVNELLELNLSDVVMADIAAGVGSDCPFFIYNSPILATGRGEILTPVAGLADVLKKYQVAVVKAENTAVSTAEAYAGISPAVPDETPELTVCRPVEQWRSCLINDFEAGIFGKIDTPSLIKRKMYDLGAVYAAMSGSGSAVYGIFEKSTLNGEELSSLFPDCKTHLGNFIL